MRAKLGAEFALTPTLIYAHKSFLLPYVVTATFTDTQDIVSKTTCVHRLAPQPSPAITYCLLKDFLRGRGGSCKCYMRLLSY